MLVNARRGEVAARLDGKDYRLCLTLGGLAELETALGAGDLVMLAIGAVIGAGIFGAIGTAAAGQVAPDGTVIRYAAGPALIFSFILLGGACALAALCYAELAAMIPQAGSAYAYSYATPRALVPWILGWGLSGPLFHFSDTWQLVINTGTTIVTFLMVFLIQSTQNRDAKAIHLKLDELIRAMRGARDDLVLLENLSEDELERLAGEFEKLRKHAYDKARTRKPRLETAVIAGK